MILAARFFAQIEKGSGNVKKIIEEIAPVVLHYLLQIVLAFVILWIGSRLIKFAVKLLEKSLKKSRAEAGVISFLSSVLRYVLYFVLVMIILGQFGVTTSSVVAVLGSAGLTIGLALQGGLTNFAGGVLILLLKPFVVGDYILEESSGKEGIVSDITIFYTKLLTVDNKVIVVPNGNLSNNTITNFSHMEKRRIDLSVGVSYHSDLKQVKEVLKTVVERENAVLSEEPIDIFVDKLGDSSVDMGVRVWVKNEDYWTTKWSMLEAIKEELEKNGVTIPFPQMDVHVKS